MAGLKEIDWTALLAPGYNWKEAYPLVTDRAKEILSSDDFAGTIGMTDLAREIGGPEVSNATRGSIIRGLRAGCKHELKDWHYRQEAPNPYRHGETMQRYFFRNYVAPKPEETCPRCGASETHWNEEMTP